MKQGLILTAFLLFTTHLISQDQNVIDSLSRIIEVQEGKERFRSMHELSAEYLFYDTKQALPHIENEMAYAKKLGDSTLIGESINIYGVLLNLDSEYKKSIVQYNKAKVIYEAIGEKELLAKTLNNMANSHRQLGNYEKSISIHMEALQLKEEFNADLENLAASYWNIGNAQGDVKNYEESTNWYKKAEDAYKKLNLEFDLISVQTLMAYNYNDLKQYDKALPYFEKAITYYKGAGRNTDLAGIYNVVGDLYYNQEQYELAEDYYLKSIRTSQDYNEVTLTAKSKRNLGHLYGIQGKYEKALIYLFDALKTFEERDTKVSLYHNYKMISHVYIEMGNYKEGYSYYTKYSELRDEVLDKEKLETVNELEIQYQTEKKEAALALQEEEIKTLNAQAKNDKLTKTLYGVGMVSLLVTAGLLYFGFKQRIKRNKIEREKQEEIYKQEIAYKKKELTSQTLHLVKKNTFIQELKENLERIKQSPELFKVEFRRLVMLLKKENAEDKDWEVFKSYFSEVHNNFDHKIKAISNEVTEKEIRLASFLRMNLSTKEIASMLNVLPDSVIKSKYRLKKKLALGKNDDLTQFLNTL